MNTASEGPVGGIHQEFLHNSIRKRKTEFFLMHKGSEEVLHKENIKISK